MKRTHICPKCNGAEIIRVEENSVRYRTDSLWILRDLCRNDFSGRNLYAHWTWLFRAWSWIFDCRIFQQIRKHSITFFQRIAIRIALRVKMF